MSGAIPVTGASGFLGRARAKALAQTGGRVHGWSIEDGDIAGAQADLSWRPRVTLEEGLAKVARALAAAKGPQ